MRHLASRQPRDDERRQVEPVPGIRTVVVVNRPRDRPTRTGPAPSDALTPRPLNS